eukprot:COSAG04_NODE_2461_length_4084_cov_1.596738_1_plen_254_part_10
MGTQDSSEQYDSYVGGGEGTKAQMIGYLFTQPYTIDQVRYTEGKHFDDGGWWVTGPNVEVDVNGVWTPVTGQRVVPALPSVGDHSEASSYETFVFTFNPVATTAIRLTGTAGGSAKFISVGELRVMANFPIGCTPTGLPPPLPTPPPGCVEEGLTPAPSPPADATGGCVDVSPTCEDDVFVKGIVNCYDPGQLANCRATCVNRGIACGAGPPPPPTDANYPPPPPVWQPPPPPPPVWTPPPPPPPAWPPPPPPP